MRSFIVSMWSSSLIRFILVGGTATLLQMLLLMFLIELVAMPPVSASAVSYMLSALYNYAANFYFTFSSAAAMRHRDAAPKFVLVSVIGVATNTLVFAAANNVLSYYVIAQLVAIMVTLVINYTLHRYWIYRSKT